MTDEWSGNGRHVPSCTRTVFFLRSSECNSVTYMKLHLAITSMGLLPYWEASDKWSTVMGPTGA